MCDPSLAPYGGSWRALFLSLVAATRPISELLDQGITALTTLKGRVEGGREEGTEDEEGEEEEGKEEVVEEVKVLPQTKWVRALFEVGT